MKVKYLIPLIILTIIITFYSFSCGTPGLGDQTIEEQAQETTEEITTEEPGEEVKEEAAAEEPALEEEVAETVIGFFEAIKKNQKIEDYIDEEFTFFVEDFEEYIERLRQYNKIKITKVTFLLDSYIGVKLCDKEGFCQGYYLELGYDEEDRRWVVYDVKKMNIRELEELLEGRRNMTFSPEPSNIVREYFAVVKERRYSELSKFVPKEFRREFDKHFNENKDEVIERFDEELYFPFDKIEILFEDDEGTAYCEALLLDKEGYTDQYEFYLIRIGVDVWIIRDIDKVERT